MILLDTHAWVWWVHGDARLSEEHRERLDAHVVEGIGVSIISCWEVASWSNMAAEASARCGRVAWSRPRLACSCLTSPCHRGRVDSPATALP